MSVQPPWWEPIVCVLKSPSLSLLKDYSTGPRWQQTNLSPSLIRSHTARSLATSCPGIKINYRMGQYAEMGNYMLPGTGSYSRSVSVSGAAFRLLSHILMLSTAGMGLTVSPALLDNTWQGGLGIWWHCLNPVLLHVRWGWIPLIFLISNYTQCRWQYSTSLHVLQ